MHRIIGLLTVEAFVLVAALFLFAYVKKNDIGKWLQYIAASIAIFIAVLMVGSVFTCCSPCYKPVTGWNYNSTENSCFPRTNDNCCKGGNNSCSMGGMKEDCCMGGSGNRECEKEICVEIDEEEMEGDSVKKKVIIKKTR